MKFFFLGIVLLFLMSNFAPGSASILDAVAPSAHASEALVTIHPAAGTYAARDIFTVEVWVENVTSLYGADIQLQFDPAAFQALDSNPLLPGTQVKLRSDLLKPGFIIHREANNQAGTIWYANSQANPALPVSGSGALFEFKFVAISNGVFPLSIHSQQLSDKSGIPISSSAQGAIYTLSGYKLFLPLAFDGHP